MLFKLCEVKIVRGPVWIIVSGCLAVNSHQPLLRHLSDNNCPLLDERLGRRRFVDVCRRLGVRLLEPVGVTKVDCQVGGDKFGGGAGLGLSYALFGRPLLGCLSGLNVPDFLVDP